jgi:hypothetical protein
MLFPDPVFCSENHIYYPILTNAYFPDWKTFGCTGSPAKALQKGIQFRDSCRGSKASPAWILRTARKNEVIT